MRPIRFNPEMLRLIREGRKTMTFRRTERPLGLYAVEGGGANPKTRISTGDIIRIYAKFPVFDVPQYASRYYEEEGARDAGELLGWLRAIYGQLPKAGHAHRFEVVQAEAVRAVARRRARG